MTVKKAADKHVLCPRALKFYISWAKAAQIHWGELFTFKFSKLKVEMLLQRYYHQFALCVDLQFNHLILQSFEMFWVICIPAFRLHAQECTHAQWV
jgi:hypothetical protein